MNNNFKLAYGKKTQRAFTLLLILIVLSMGSAMLLYGEKYHFLDYPLSYLGGLKTVNGKSNLLSFLAISVGFVTGGILMFIIGYYFKKQEDLKNKSLIRFFCYTGGVGFFIFLFPYNRYPALHVIGSSLMFGSLWFLANLFLIEALQSISFTTFLLFQFILQVTVIPYAISYMLSLNTNSFLQKIAVVGLVFVLRTSILLKEY
jgi:hypothetical protein